MTASLDVLTELKKIVDHQAEMASLWHMYPSHTEYLVRMALSHLHAIIKQDLELAERYKHIYWDLESEL